MEVLVHFKPMGLETEETKQLDQYMTFNQLKQHSLLKLKEPEVPVELCYGGSALTSSS
jgi:hypothetical protein